MDRNMVLEGTKIAYADCIPMKEWEEALKLREMEWHGYWVDGELLLEQALVIDEYNAFNYGIAKALVEYYRNKNGLGVEFRLGREQSVVVYVRSEGGLDAPPEGAFRADEIDQVDADTIRFWWD